MTILRTASTFTSAQLPFGRDALTLRKENVGRLVALALILLISAGILLGWEQIQRLGSFGYPAIFLVSVVGNAVLFLPAPSIAFVLAAGASLDPLLVGLFAGMGAAIGEMTGYLAGYGGQTVLKDRPLYNRVQGWMESKGPFAIFILAAVPNPFFDIGGIVAGVMRMPAWQFLFATALGKSLRFALLAGIGVLAAG
ncbi:MAG: YqaA family protein [Candidatus Promineifilaceae bacterium]|jgi:membrane protein YqaA with SNARE-associated domain